MTKTGFVFATLASLLLGVTHAAPPKVWDPSPYSQAVTQCDRLASHGEDPFRVAPGQARATMDLPAAITACESAVAAEPSNPRLRYQLGRVYGYSGQGEKSVQHREAAIAADYPQALFVVGYLHLLGLNKARKDVCRAGELIRRSAIYGRLAGQVGFPRYAAQGLFDECPVPKDATEMLQFLDAAAEQASGYYQSMLVETLREDVMARWPIDN